MISEEEKQKVLAEYEAAQRAENGKFGGKAHRVIKSSKGKYPSNRQPGKKKRKK